MLTPAQGEAVVRIVETAPQVRRRTQFFVWAQGPLQSLLPHDVLACGAYQRQRGGLGFEVFNSAVLPPVALGALGDAQQPLLAALLAAWIDGGGRPLRLDARALRAADAAAAELAAQGLAWLSVHGVARPQRSAELESFFVLGGPPGRSDPFPLAHFELLLPHLHATWLRVCAEEKAQGLPPAALPSVAAPAARTAVTSRERQILDGVRAGKSNQQIAEVLGLSPLTVKNHVQKILRKLEAANRAQAVARAMALGLLDV